MEGEFYFAGILDEIIDDLGGYVRYNERDKTKFCNALKWHVHRSLLMLFAKFISHYMNEGL